MCKITGRMATPKDIFVIRENAGVTWERDACVTANALKTELGNKKVHCIEVTEPVEIGEEMISDIVLYTEFNRCKHDSVEGCKSAVKYWWDWDKYYYPDIEYNTYDTVGDFYTSKGI